MNLTRALLLLVLATLAVTNAFAPLVPTRQGLSASRSILFYKTNDRGALSEIIAQQSPILASISDGFIETSPAKISVPKLKSKSKPKPQVERKILLPPKKSPFEKNTWLTSIRKRWTSMTKSLLRPGVKFRARLGLIAMAAISVASLLVPRARLLNVAKGWVAHRGFQGISALGRSVTYCWALLVGYPRMLDRRANEGRVRERERALEKRRDRLTSLAGEVSRLRQELATIDTEIRAFRREIIALKAYAKDDSPDVQEAIGLEMAHLADLRSDTQAALTAARQIWADVRKKSPPEVWDDIELTI